MTHYHYGKGGKSGGGKGGKSGGGSGKGGKKKMGSKVGKGSKGAYTYNNSMSMSMPPVPIEYDWQRVGTGICLDAIGNLYSSMSYIPFASVEECQDSCAGCPGQNQRNSVLRGITYRSNTQTCYCNVEGNFEGVESVCGRILTVHTGTGPIFRSSGGGAYECYSATVRVA